MPFSLSIDSLKVFCLLRVHPKGPKGGWDTKSEDPKGPWTEEVTGTWEKEDSTLVFFRVLEACESAFFFFTLRPKDPEPE